jgi:hypothetical protein
LDSPNRRIFLNPTLIEGSNPEIKIARPVLQKEADRGHVPRGILALTLDLARSRICVATDIKCYTAELAVRASVLHVINIRGLMSGL